MSKQKKINGIVVAIALLSVAIFPMMNSIGAGEYEPMWDSKMLNPQFPDPIGWDVGSSISCNIADDWQCTETGPITHIRWWGSWDSDEIGEICDWTLTIYSDINASQSPTGYSMPDELLWNQFITVFNITEQPPSPQGMYYPGSPPIYSFDNHVRWFRYDIDITDAFFTQTEGTIYWLSIYPAIMGPQTWGWKSSLDHWNDNAAYNDIMPWQEIYEPPAFEEPIDLAFIIGGYSDENSTMNISGLTDNNLTWSGYGGEPNVWCNNSGLRNETLEIDLLINSTVNCSGINLWLGDLYNSSVNYWVNASNMTVYVSTDNNTFFLLNQSVGNGDGIPLDGGCNLTINYTTWGTAVGNPWILYGNQHYITTNCSIYVRIEMDIPVPFYYDNHTIWQNYSSNFVRFSNNVPWWVYANGSGPFAYDDFGGLLIVQKSWFRKPGYTNCTYGVPDFDQKQVAGTTFPWDCIAPDGITQQWYMDGPTALCDCLWWLDCKRNPTGDIDSYWMPDFYGNGSKDKNNVVPTIEWMSFMMNTTVGTPAPFERGTTAENFTQGIYNIFDYLGVNDSYNVRVDGYRDMWELPIFVPYENITRELDACQDVILLLGFWHYSEGSWYRAGGHYVQCNGHSEVEQALSFSDPYYDNAGNGGWGWYSNHTIPHDASSHNNTDNVSYDYYSVFNDSISPGGYLYVDEYPIMPPDALTWSYMNWWDTCPWMPPSGGDLLHIEIEMAWYICEEICFEVNKTVWNGTAWVKEYEDATVGETLNFNISIHNCGKNSSHNITVYDTYYDGLEYAIGTSYITYANGTRVQRDPDWISWEQGTCEYANHGHLQWSLCGNESVNLTYCDYIYIEYNLTLNNNNYTKNEVTIFVCNESCGCAWDDVILQNSSSCYVGQQFTNITCNCVNSPESSNWSVSEHINRNCTCDGSCLDEEWFEYETEFDRWCPYNTSIWMAEDWGWVYRYNNWDGNGTDDNGLSWTIANESCINRSQSIVRMRVEINASLIPPEPWAIPFIGVIYSYTNNSEWDAVMYGYENNEIARPIVVLLSKIGDYLYNTNDTTLVVNWNDAYNYWHAGWSCNQTNVLDDDIETNSPHGIWAKTIYNEYCGHVQAKAWQAYPEEFCPDSIGMCQEPSGWIYDNIMTTVENDNATCFGLVVWNPLVQIGEEEFTRLDFRADFDFIEEWRLNYSFDEHATTAQKEAHCPEMGGNIPYQYLPCFDYAEYNRQESAFAEIVHDWATQNITNLTFYDASACHFRNKSNFIYDTSRSHTPKLDCGLSYTWNNQNDTIYYRTAIETNNSHSPDMLHFHIEDAPDGTNDSDDACVICIDVDNDQVWGDNDLCFFWTNFGSDYTVWNGTQVFSNSSQPHFDAGFSIAFDECMYSESDGTFQPLHRYSPHRQYSLSIPLCILQKGYFGSYDLLEAGDTIGLHMQTINYAETLVLPSISPVWENWNETACSFLTTPENFDYLTWDAYMNVSDANALTEFWLNDTWNGTTATQMQYWGQARVGDEYPLSDPWSINVTKESNITKIENTSQNTTVVFNVTVCNNGTAPVTNIIVKDTFPNCCEYINSSLPAGNVTHQYPCGMFLHMDENTGYWTNDSSGNGNNGELINGGGGPQWTTGKINYALYFNETDKDYVKVLNNATITPSEISVALWLKANTSATTEGHDMVMVDKYSSTSETGYGVCVDSYYSNDVIGWYLGSNGHTEYLRSNEEIVVGEWYHMVTTYDGYEMKVYINGSLDNSKLFTGGIYDYTGDLYIGGPYSSGTNYYGGTLDEISIWNQALTPSEVLTLYTSNNGPGNHTQFNVTNNIDVGSCTTFNITVNFTANCAVPDGTILNNIIYAYGDAEVNATDNYGIQYGNNTAPVINWQYPINSGIDVPLLLANISVNVSDANDDLMTIYFYTNKSDDTWYSVWNPIGTNLSVTNGTYQCNQTFNNSQTMNTRWRWGNTTYHWYVNVTDGNIWTNASYSFTTEGYRDDVDTNNVINALDLSCDWNRRTVGAWSIYYGLFDVNADTNVNTLDLSLIWAHRS